MKETGVADVGKLEKCVGARLDFSFECGMQGVDHLGTSLLQRHEVNR